VVGIFAFLIPISGSRAHPKRHEIRIAARVVHAEVTLTSSLPLQHELKKVTLNQGPQILHSKRTSTASTAETSATKADKAIVAITHLFLIEQWQRCRQKPEGSEHVA
jgi:hypothetical protein